MITTKNIIINGSKEKPVTLDVCYKQNGKPKPVIVFSHGFKGFKDWGHFNVMAKSFAEAGFVFIKFNFSHNGISPGNLLEFTDLDAFGNNNYLIELDDLKLVIDWALENIEMESEVNKDELYLLGHSRGGGITVIKAAEDTRVKKVCTWASVSDIVNRNKQRTVETWKKDGVVYAHNGRTKQEMPLFVQFYNTLLAHKDRLNITKAAKHLTIPFLIIHGTADEAVSSNDALALRKASPHSELAMIQGGDHTFDAKHPYRETILRGNTEFVVNKTIDFFKN